MPGIVTILASVALLAMAPVIALAGQCREAPAVATTGRPLELSGAFTDIQKPVEISARNGEGALREGNMVMAGTTWRGSLVFRAVDGGPWTLRLVVDGVACESALSVRLPDGVTAPPHETPTTEELLITRPPVITTGGIRTAGALGAAALVVGSWVFLLVVAIIPGFRRRSLAMGKLLALARAAAFVGVLGGFLASYGFVWLVVAIGHFDSAIPDEQEAMLRVGLGATVAAGSWVGAIAARRIARAATVPVR